MPMCHGIVLDESSDAQPHTLLQTTLSSYVKKDFPNMTTGEMEEGDVQGSFSVAASSTRAAETGESKLVWYASPAIINDQWDYYVGGTNSALFMASVNWMCEKTTSLSILAKQMQIEPLVVPEASVNMWTIILIVAVPVAFLGSGFYVWFRRRRR